MRAGEDGLRCELAIKRCKINAIKIFSTIKKGSIYCRFRYCWIIAKQYFKLKRNENFLKIVFHTGIHRLIDF